MSAAMFSLRFFGKNLVAKALKIDIYLFAQRMQNRSFAQRDGALIFFPALLVLFP